MVGGSSSGGLEIFFRMRILTIRQQKGHTIMSTVSYDEYPFKFKPYQHQKDALARSW